MKRTGQSKIAVVGWGRGMGHKGHMYLADAVIEQARMMNADPYFFVSKTVGKDDPIFPEEKIKIYQKVFPQQATIFTPQGNLNQALTELAQLGYQGVVVVVGADQKQAFQYLEKPNKEGVPVYQSMGLQKLRVISRQETGNASAGLEGPRATPMREVLLHPEASEQQKFKVWRDAMPDALGDKEVMDLMKKAEARLLGSHTKKTKVAESRIMDRDARINAYYVSKKGDKHRVAENIPYYLLDKLVPLLTKKYAITMNDIEVRPVDQTQYCRTSKPELAESIQSNPNEVAELLYKVKPEIFSRFGDDFVMDAIAQACEQHTGSAQEVAVKVVEILKQGIAEGRKANTKAARKEFGARSRKENPAEQDAKKKESDEAWQRLMQYAADQKKEQGVAEGEEEALAYATQAHAGQTRSGGDPYITHPIRVADHIRKYKQSHNLDALISAAYLHDTIEDTDTTQEILHDLFGGLVASLVKELTSDPEQIKKMGKAAYLSHKMAAMSSYGLVIKLADRLDNVKDITTARTPQWRAKYAAETNQILDYIEKTRALTGTHNKLISLIRAKLAEIDNPQQGVAEDNDIKIPTEDGITIQDIRLIAGEGPLTKKTILQAIATIRKQRRPQGMAEESGITRRGILKGLAGAGALGAAGKASAIAGAFPTPSHQQAMYKAAELSNAAEAKRLAAKKAQADSERLKTNTDLVDKEQRINHHSLEPKGMFNYPHVNGKVVRPATTGQTQPENAKLVTSDEGEQMYVWSVRFGQKGDTILVYRPAQELKEFAPGNGDDDKPTAEYEVYQCQLDDQFDWIGGPLYQSDDMGKVHGFAYEMWKKHPDKCFMIWQERSQGSRGGYGPEGSVLAPSEEDLSENSDYLDEK